MPARIAWVRRIVFVYLEPSAWPRDGLSPVNKLIVFLILAAVVAAVAETEVALTTDKFTRLFDGLETAFGVLFLFEYALRVWSAVENPKYGGPGGRLRYVRSPAAIVDLLAVLPVLVAPIGGEAFVLRLFRLLRIMRLARLGRFSSATAAIVEAVHSRRYELAMTVVVGMFLLLASSTLLYLVEAETQPVAFGSIPRAMWWSIATLTTVGYGDVTPATLAGRLLAGVTALTGIGLIAMPTGILAAAFSDALRRQGADGQRGEMADKEH
jgi:voltage-gated potassium channel